MKATYLHCRFNYFVTSNRSSKLWTSHIYYCKDFIPNYGSYFLNLNLIFLNVLERHLNKDDININMNRSERCTDQKSFDWDLVICEFVCDFLVLRPFMVFFRIVTDFTIRIQGFGGVRLVSVVTYRSESGL